jgi:hypothetical protein
MSIDHNSTYSPNSVNILDNDSPHLEVKRSGDRLYFYLGNDIVPVHPGLDIISALADSYRKMIDEQDAETDRLRRMPYQDYLHTEHWQSVRTRKLEYAGWHCELCYADKSLNVHHKTYERRGCEEDNDLIVLCGDCHAKFHDKLPEQRPPRPMLQQQIEAMPKIVRIEQLPPPEIRGMSNGTWPDILAYISLKNQTLGALLSRSHIVSYIDDILTLRISEGWVKEKLELKTEQIESVLGIILDTTLAVEFVLQDGDL